MLLTSEKIVDFFRERELHEKAQSYIRSHAKRYAFLLEHVSNVRAALGQPDLPVTILDIGPSFFTELLRHAFPQDSIITLGFDSQKSRGGHFPLSIRHKKATHFAFDLNDSLYPERWIQIPEAKLVILAEIIEHLYTSPKHVLSFVRSLMAPGGYLFIQTPNAATLKKRMKLLWGANPFEMIREDRDNPGHFREYTSRELHTLARAAGFEVVVITLSNYHSHDSSKSILGRIIRPFFSYPNFRRGITMTLQNPP